MKTQPATIDDSGNQGASRTAGEAGWHVSRYNLVATVPGSRKAAIANLYKGVCAEYAPVEMYLLSVLEELDEHHPIIERFAKRGVICDFDERGNLQKRWEAVDKPAVSFGTAHDWDPADPLATASNPDNLTMYLNTAGPVPDGECRECVWLPMCAGGCPHRRLFYGRQCVPFRDDPEAYALALHARIGEGKSDKKEQA